MSDHPADDAEPEAPEPDEAAPGPRHEVKPRGPYAGAGRPSDTIGNSGP